MKNRFSKLRRTNKALINKFEAAFEAARTYDQYIVDNNLEHTKNF